MTVHIVKVNSDFQGLTNKYCYPQWGLYLIYFTKKTMCVKTVFKFVLWYQENVNNASTYTDCAIYTQSAMSQGDIGYKRVTLPWDIQSSLKGNIRLSK